MKIAIIGYSGSGKSTLARKLGAYYHIPVLHLDSVHHLPGWEARELASEQDITHTFLKKNTDWVIDGNYSKNHYEMRMEEADMIIMLLFNRFSCLQRAHHRFRVYRNQTRPDMAEGCNEKLDIAFVKWILLDGRTRERRARYERVAAQYANKFVRIKHQRALTAYMKTQKSEVHV